MKRLNSLFKVVAMMVIVSLFASLVTACDGQNDDRTDFTTRETETGLMPNVSEPNQTINTVDPTETATATESTPAPAGKYTYTVYAGTEYETTLSMDVNIDDYILNVEGESVPFFSIGCLWEDLGYLVDGSYKPSEYDWTNSPVYESYAYGDTQMVFRFNGPYSNSDNPSGYPQMYNFDYHLAPISNYEANANTIEKVQSSEANYGVIVQFNQHPEDICYYTSGCNGFAEGLSREDAIIIAYVLSSAITRPGENPFIGTNLEKAQTMNADYYLTYTLP